MTSTGFHLMWEADVTLRPTFHLSATAPKGPAVALETREHNAKLSGLEPGVSYLVELTAKACGEEGAGTRLKVRTGKVWGWGSCSVPEGEARRR